MLLAVQIAAVALLCALGATLLQRQGSPLAAVMRLAAVVCFAGAMLQSVSDVFATLQQFLQHCGVAPAYLVLLLKGAGVCWVGECAAALCTDMNEQALAQQVQLCARAVLLGLTLPTLIDICSMLLAAMEVT